MITVLICVLVGAVVFGALRAANWALWRFYEPSTVSRSNEPLSLGAAAYLFGGPVRVRETWWVALRERGLIEKSAELGEAGEILYAVSPRAAENKEAALESPLRTVAALGTRPYRPATFFHRWEKESEKERSELIMGGYAHSNYTLRSAASILSSAAFWMVLAVALICMWAGLSMWSLAGIAAGFVLHVLVNKRAAKKNHVRATEFGRQTQAGLRAIHAANTRAPRTGDASLAVMVAGSSVLIGTPSEALASEAMMAKPVGSASGSGGCGGGGFVGCGGEGSPGAPASEGGFTTGGVFGGSTGFSSGGDAGGSGCSSSSSGGSSGCGGGGGCGGS